jgi:hypothetical protein
LHRCADLNIVYVGYQNFVGSDYDIYVQRSTDGGATWEAPVQVNDDPGARHQIFPTIAVSNGTLHVAWYDFRNSATAANEALDVYYACSNCGIYDYPVFSPSERVTDISHNGNCLMFTDGTAAFHDATSWRLLSGVNRIVHLAGATTGMLSVRSIRHRAAVTIPATAPECLRHKIVALRSVERCRAKHN